jgi:HlyD family secretion protein
MKRRAGIVAIAIALAGAGAAYYRLGASTERPDVVTGVVSRGAVVETVEATGTVSPVDTVEVGSQVTGTVKTLGADFNSRVAAGQVLATLDPASLQAQVDQAAATVARLVAEVNRAKVTLADAETKLRRAEALARDQLIAQADFETAQTTRDAAQAAVGAAEAQVVQARASLDQARVNLGRTIIRAPSAGVVLSRNVEVGQTVTSGLQTPTLFVIARDLHKMQLQVSVDEADISHVLTGQPVTFTVDAYGVRQFAGRVSQVRLQPLVSQNVVSYTTIIDVDNPDLALKPGMTATVHVETARSDNTLRVPAAAIRFRPSAEVLQALGSADQAITRSRPVANARAERGRDAHASDRGAVWTFADGRLARVPVEVGVSDGAFVAVSSPRLSEGTTIVTGVATAASAAAPTPSSSPLVPAGPRRSGAGAPRRAL